MTSMWQYNSEKCAEKSAFRLQLPFLSSEVSVPHPCRGKRPWVRPLITVGRPSKLFSPPSLLLPSSLNFRGQACQIWPLSQSYVPNQLLYLHLGCLTRKESSSHPGLLAPPPRTAPGSGLREMVD